MNDPLLNHLREIRWRRPLTASEEAELRAWLAANPKAREDWELEAALSVRLAELPDAAVSSNFTARVLQAVERETRAAPRAKFRWRVSWRSFVPKAALAAVAFSLGLFTYHEHAVAKRLELAQSVAAFSEVSSLPSPEILKDFEAIRRLNTTPPPDEELLALMK
jgi:anti-sigma factor RsiW